MNKIIPILVIAFLLNSFSFTLYSQCKMNSSHHSEEVNDSESCCHIENSSEYSTENLIENKISCSNDIIGTSQCECCIKQASDKKNYLIIISTNQNLKEYISGYETENLQMNYLNSDSEHLISYKTPLPQKDITILHENFRI